MRMEHGAAVFRMELRTYIPAESGNFYDFNQVGLRIDARTLHAGSFVFGLVLIVELVAVAVAFLDVLSAESFLGFASFLQHTFVGTQTHGSAHIGDGLLFFHDVDHVVRCLLVHLA